MICAEERYKKILEILEGKDYVSTNELIEKLQTSRETVRRDLNALAARGAILKTHGGATSWEIAAQVYDTPIVLRANTNLSAKQAIAKYAVQFIQKKDTIFIDNSSTAACLISYIPKNYQLTLITYSVQLILELAKITIPNWKIVLLGGDLDFNTFSTGSYIATNTLSMFKPAKAFISCHGIDSTFYMTDSYMNDVELKRLVIANSRETFLLIDSSKLNRNGVINIDSATSVDYLITNTDANSKFLDQLRKQGCDIHLA